MLSLQSSGRSCERHPHKSEVVGGPGLLLSQDPGPGLGMTVVSACQVSLGTDYGPGFVTHSEPRLYREGSSHTVCLGTPRLSLSRFLGPIPEVRIERRGVDAGAGVGSHLWGSLSLGHCLVLVFCF